MRAVPALLITCLALSCTGPRPEVVSVDVIPVSGEPGKYRVDVGVRNRSASGEGQASVSVRLVDSESQESYQKSEVLELKPGEVSHLSVEISAPAGKKLVGKAEVHYPPD